MTADYKAICSRCGARMSNIEFNVHTCEGMRDIFEMPDDILLRNINKEITEAEAWELADTRKAEAAR